MTNSSHDSWRRRRSSGQRQPIADPTRVHAGYSGRDNLPPVPVSDSRQELAGLPTDGSKYLTKGAVKFRASLWSTLQLVVAATLAVAIFSGLQNESVRSFVFRRGDAALGHPAAVRSIPAASQATPASNPAGMSDKSATITPVPGSLEGLAGVPLPSFFGVYAIARGRLTNLRSFRSSYQSARPNFGTGLDTECRHLARRPTAIYRIPERPCRRCAGSHNGASRGAYHAHVDLR